jgi:hypothetical protein
MASAVFPAPSSAPSITAEGVLVPSALVTHIVTDTLSAGIYQITTSPNTSQATVKFYNGATELVTGTTVNGSISVILPSTALKYYIVTDTGSNVLVTVNLIATVNTGVAYSGTLDTITTSGTHNATGYKWVLAVGAGGGGAGGAFQGRGGGGAGSVAIFQGTNNSAQTVTIGTAGNGGAAGGSSGNAGNSTSFGSLAVAAGGNGGVTQGTGNTSGIVANTLRDVINGTNGSGGQGNWFPNSGVGAGLAGYGSGIGTGGDGGSNTNGSPNAGGVGTGYGAGGGGGAAGGNSGQSAGGAGSPGVVYVLRDIVGLPS